MVHSVGFIALVEMLKHFYDGQTVDCCLFHPTRSAAQVGCVSYCTLRTRLRGLALLPGKTLCHVK